MAEDLGELFFGASTEGVRLIEQMMRRNGIDHPYSLEDIAKVLQFEIVVEPLPSSVCGFVRKDERVIFINKNHSPHRNALALAHEIGHLVLPENSRQQEAQSPDNPLTAADCDTFGLRLLSNLQKKNPNNSLKMEDVLRHNPEATAILVFQGLAYALGVLIERIFSYFSDVDQNPLKRRKLLGVAVFFALVFVVYLASRKKK